MQSQMMITVNPQGPGSSILNTQNIVWAIDAANEQCCIDPSQTGLFILSSAETGRPFRLGFQQNLSIFDFSYYSTNPADFPPGIFDVPSYCPWKITNPNCSIV